MPRRFSLGCWMVATAMLSAGCNAEHLLCAGSIQYDEPLVRIAAVTDAASGAFVSPTTLSQFRMGETDLSPMSFIAAPGLINAVVADGTLICNIACAFG